MLTFAFEFLSTDSAFLKFFYIPLNFKYRDLKQMIISHQTAKQPCITHTATHTHTAPSLYIDIALI